jgi:hypothetical protein
MTISVFNLFIFLIDSQSFSLTWDINFLEYDFKSLLICNSLPKTYFNQWQSKFLLIVNNEIQICFTKNLIKIILIKIVLSS